MNKNSIIIIVVVLVLIILIGSITLVIYYFNNMKNECVSSPFVFGAKQLEQQYGYNFSGMGWFNVPMGYQNLRVTFNSTSMNIN